ncbi:MAG: LamB/YcsF family protein [Planctomycetes bacterium]|nr:LamB/YcsF family protein [Planctomycetota bacterium]
MTRFIDLNADAGESPDPAADLPFLEVVTSVNIACGVHAGGPATISRLSEAAAARGVGVGAHPGLADGRVERPVGAEEAKAAVSAQVEEFRRHVKAPVQHVKLHGMLYHAAREPKVAKAVAEAVRALGIPILVAQAGSPLEKAAREAKVRVVGEAFLDRAYRADGTLVPRGQPGALLQGEDASAKRAVQLALKRRVSASDGSEVEVDAGTFCVHTDSPGALATARAAREALERAGVVVRPMGAA